MNKMRRCKLCRRDISELPSAARYCKVSSCVREQRAIRHERRKAADRKYMRKIRIKQKLELTSLHGAGLRFCRCGADISHQAMQILYCEECSADIQKLTGGHLQKELKQLHEINPQRWAVDILAMRYQLPREQVQEWVAATH